jgi:hypothetical protein
VPGVVVAGVGIQAPGIASTSGVVRSNLSAIMKYFEISDEAQQRKYGTRQGMAH